MSREGVGREPLIFLLPQPRVSRDSPLLKGNGKVCYAGHWPAHGASHIIRSYNVAKKFRCNFYVCPQAIHGVCYVVRNLSRNASGDYLEIINYSYVYSIRALYSLRPQHFFNSFPSKERLAMRKVPS